jgi:hypothetical protein
MTAAAIAALVGSGRCIHRSLFDTGRHEVELRSGYNFSAASGEGETFLFVVANAIGSIEHPEQLIEGERFVILEANVPMFLKTLVGAKCAHFFEIIIEGLVGHGLCR